MFAPLTGISILVEATHQPQFPQFRDLTEKPAKWTEVDYKVSYC